MPGQPRARPAHLASQGAVQVVVRLVLLVLDVQWRRMVRRAASLSEQVVAKLGNTDVVAGIDIEAML